MTQIAAGHPGLDVLAAFIDGNLSSEELKSVIAHVRDCDDCRSIVRMAVQFQREGGQPAGASVRNWIASVIAASLLLVIGIALYRRQSDPLRALQGERRRIEARLTAFDYAPFEPARRSATVDMKLQMHIEELSRRVKADRNVSTLHRLALGHLALGRAADARSLLMEASELDPMNAALLSDLAAAQLATNETAQAAETSARALERDPRLAAARFNWALALETLPVRPTAITAWNDYLQFEHAGKWADEARTRMARLQKRRISWNEDKLYIVDGVDAKTLGAIVGRHPQQVRAWVLRELLPQWIREGRQDYLTIAFAIGRMRAAVGDRYVLEVVDHAAREKDPRLREGIQLFGVASRYLRDRQTERAGDLYTKAADLLRETASPLALSADIAAASTDFYGGRSDAALVRLDRVATALRTGGDRYSIVAAEEEWIRGLVWSRRDANTSLEAYRRGLAAARRSNDPEVEAILTALIAEIVDRIGEPAEANRQREEALKKLDEVAAAPDRMYSAFSSNAYASLRARLPHLALAFIDAQQSFAGKDPLLLAESDGVRALALRDLGRFRDAAQFIVSARAHVPAIATKGLRDRTESNLAFIAGTIDAKSNPAAAVASLTNAIRIWSEYQWHVHNATAYLVRGEAHLALRRRAAAEADFRAGIAEIEQQREEMSEPRMREAYFERAERLFASLVQLLIEEKRFEDALTVAERKRARELLEAVAAHDATRGVEPLEASVLAAAIASPTAIVEYMLLDRGAAIWVLREGRTEFVQQYLSRAMLEGMIRDHRAAINANDPVLIERHGRALYDELIDPISAHLRDAANVIVVGDGALQTVPFAALVGPDRRYLIQSVRLAVSPSASVVVRNQNIVTGGSGVLVVAQPAPSGMEFLTHVEAEVREVASVYGNGGVLRGGQVSPDEFLYRSGHVSTVHFAGHAIVEEHQPAASALVFESALNRTPTLLRASTVASAWLPSRPLVVLAGCSSGRGPLKQTEGVDSLAAAFLRAGARGVVATLWDIEDDASSRLLRTFHRRLETGATVGEALRDAQLSLLESKEPNDRGPRSWAGFVVFGTQ